MQNVLALRPLVLLSAMLLAACAADSTTRSGDGPRLGMRFNQPYPAMFGGGSHAGLDIDVPLGTTVRSPADGTVSVALTMDLRGNATNIVMIDHGGGISSRYLHIDRVTVKPGDKIKQGESFAATALNGPGGPNTSALVPYPHLHFEVYRDGARVDPESLRMGCSGTAFLWPVPC